MARNPAHDWQTPVAIVGAGPVGLSLALGLARHGVRSTLVEKNPATSEHSKAPGIHIRTREVLRLWGVEDRLVEAGKLVSRIDLHPAQGGAPLMTIDFGGLEAEADRPGILVLDQSDTERHLLAAVQETDLSDVRFGAEAVGLVPNGRNVALTARQGGEDRVLHAQYVVGCDGAGSFVRHALGLPFDGMTYSVRPMLADVRVDNARDALPWPRLYDGPGGITAGIRLHPGVWRIIRLERGEAVKSDDVPAEELRLRAEEVLGSGPVEVVWASRFRIHLRSSPRFRVGRVLLAGDAAHIHSPAGGQGMNAGVHDAHNLAWKLAAALEGGDGERLLDSYDVERRAVAVESVSRYTDVLTRLFLQSPSVVRRAAFLSLRLALVLPGTRTRMLRRASMIDLGYPASPLVDAAERSAGRRLPNPLLRASDGSAARLYDLLPNAPAVVEVAEARPFAEVLPVDHVIRIGPGAYADSSGLLRALLGGRDGWILVRPDAHVAWARHSQEGMGEAVAKALGRDAAADR